MLTYLVRTLPLFARAFAGQDGSLVSRVERRVRVYELDVNLHMNQAVYAQVMELGRMDWMVRSLAMRRWRAQKVKPVVASQRIVYRRELALGTRYTLDTRALGMTGRLLMMQTNIVVGTQVHARNDTEVIFIGPQGVLDAHEADELCQGLPVDPLAVDDWKVTG